MKKYIILIMLILGCWVGIYAQTPQKMTYVYDALNRLTEVTYPNGSKITYNYDVLGNRTSVVIMGGCSVATATISGTSTISAGQFATIAVTLTGASPWSIVFNGVTYAAIASPFNISVSPTTTTTYTLTSVNNSCGDGTISGNFVVNFDNCPASVNYTNTQTAGVYQAAQTITSQANVTTGTSYFAGNSILLSTGFSAGPNEVFLAKIQGCATAPTNGQTRLVKPF